jgi:hypothetical protein
VPKTRVTDPLGAFFRQLLRKLTTSIFFLLSLLILMGGIFFVLRTIRPAPQPGSSKAPISTSALSIQNTPQVMADTTIIKNDLTTNIPILETPAPASSKIVFFDVRDEAADIFMVNPDGTELTNLTQTPRVIEAQPQWAVDGGHIYFLDRGGERYSGLFRINPDGADTTKLFDWQEQEVWSYEVSLDGQWVVYAATIPAPGFTVACAIFKIRIDGSDLIQLVYHLANLNIGDNAQLLVTAPTELRLANRLEPGSGAVIGPAAGSGLDATDLVLFIAGINGKRRRPGRRAQSGGHRLE